MNKLPDDIQRVMDNAVCLYSESEIEKEIDRVAKEMYEKLHDQNPLFLSVMNGAVIFTGKLITRLNFPLQMDYVHATRYRGEMQGRDLHWLSVPTISLENRVIVVMEDILDSGLTLAAVMDYCIQQNAKKVYSATLVDKNHPRDVDGVKKADFTGLTVDDKFLIGYGLDYKEYFRNLPGIYAVEKKD